jgi:hypothetical protein
MAIKIEQCVARIFSANGSIAGAGFLVSEKHVLTCAHVVAQALDVDQQAKQPPAGEVRLDFPLVAPGKTRSARVVFWQPVQAGAPDSAACVEDIAGLEFEGEPPSGSQPARLVTPSELWGHSFRAFGFPSGYDDGVWASGVLRAGQSSGWVQIEDVKETGYSVAPGFSGTPVLDDAVGAVVGMVVVSEKRPDVRAAFIIPAALLIRSWPVLAQRARPRVFISYKRDVDPDERVARQVFESLEKQCDVFIDRTMLVGTLWAERIEAELRQSDFLIAFLSSHSVSSEMVEGEIRMANSLKNQAGRPATLPVRLAYREPFQYPLSAYLDPINWAFWNGDDDTERLIDELSRAVSGGELAIGAGELRDRLIEASGRGGLRSPLPSAQPSTLEMPEGTMSVDCTLYVERPSDSIALDTIKQQGVTITIKGPRQMGKSSLLIRTIDAARRAGKRVAFLDFQLVDRAALSDADVFFRQFCAWLSDELELADRVDEFWNANMRLSNLQRSTRYVSRYLMSELGGPLLLAMDEVDSIFDADFRSDFFGMLRSWHNNRATGPGWKNLDLALVTSTEPYQLIQNLTQSPFNVGQVINLDDFSREQVSDLNRRHGSPLGAAEEDKLMQLLSGHPYLVRRALYLVASRRVTAADLFSNSTADRGPFGDHLRYHLFRMHDKKELVQGLLQIIHHKTCQDEGVFFRLRGAGLIRGERHSAIPRCQLYADYFKDHLHV